MSTRFTCEEKTGGTPFTYNCRRQRNKIRLFSEGEHTSVLQFLLFNFSVNSGGGRLLIDKKSLFIKRALAWGQRWSSMTLTLLTRRISCQSHQLHVTGRMSNTGWCNNTLNAKSWKVSTSTTVQVLLFLVREAVSTWLVAKGTRCQLLWEYCK